MEGEIKMGHDDEGQVLDVDSSSNGLENEGIDNEQEINAENIVEKKKEFRQREKSWKDGVNEVIDRYSEFGFAKVEKSKDDEYSAFAKIFFKKADNSQMFDYGRGQEFLEVLDVLTEKFREISTLKGEIQKYEYRKEKQGQDKKGKSLLDKLGAI